MGHRESGGWCSLGGGGGEEMVHTLPWFELVKLACLNLFKTRFICFAEGFAQCVQQPPGSHFAIHMLLRGCELCPWVLLCLRVGVWFSSLFPIVCCLACLGVLLVVVYLCSFARLVDIVFVIYFCRALLMYYLLFVLL